jgi:hypothetical protein
LEKNVHKNSLAKKNNNSFNGQVERRISNTMVAMKSITYDMYVVIYVQVLDVIGKRDKKIPIYHVIYGGKMGRNF